MGAENPREFFPKFRGEVAERLNAADSKSVLGQLNGGSNPPLSVWELWSLYYCFIEKCLDKETFSKVGKGLSAKLSEFYLSPI